MKSVMPKSRFFILLIVIVSVSVAGEDGGVKRRVLHQPLFPFTTSDPPPPPPPVAIPELPEQDQPFFHELPVGPTADQTQSQTPPPIGGASAAVEAPVVPRPSGQIKKAAVAAALTVVTLGLVLGLGVYFCRRRGSGEGESRKLVGGGNSTAVNVESRMPPPAASFLYIGTVEPSVGSLIDEANASGSPYRKLNSGKGFDRYRPSPELQPLPPLPKPPPPPQRSNSPPRMSSSDEDTNFYTPQRSSFSNGSPVPRPNRVPPQSKRTSPKSRLSLSSPDTKPVIIPSIKQSQAQPPPPPPEAAAIVSSLGPPLPSKTLPYNPKRVSPRFVAPPPPPDISRLRSIIVSDQEKSGIPVPPPPPLPPPVRPPGAPVQTPKSPFPKTETRSEPKGSSPKANPSNVDDEIKEDSSKPKLKPLHWDKVRATSERATVWDQMKSSSFQLNEDAMESLFGCSSSASSGKDGGRKPALSMTQQGNRVLDPKKSQNIAILLRALNVTVEEVTEALLDGNSEGLGLELLETLVKMAPTKEEEIKLKSYNGEISKLGSAERFLKEILDIPFAFKRVEAMLYRANFNNEIVYLSKSFQTLEEACEELKNSPLFLKLLEAVLRTGNRMNDGTNRGHARAFKLDTLLKLVDIKGADGKTTLLHFVVQEVIRSKGAETESDNAAAGPETNPKGSDFSMKEEEFRKKGLQVVSGLSKELGNVKKAAGMDSDVLSSYVSKLEMGLEKVKSLFQYEKPMTLSRGEFFDSMKNFVNEAVQEISRIKSQERKALSMVKEVTEYFHGDAAKEEAHPFRIFMIVRDFLSVLDGVCKEVGKLQQQDRACIGSGRSFRMTSVSNTIHG